MEMGDIMKTYTQSELDDIWKDLLAGKNDGYFPKRNVVESGFDSFSTSINDMGTGVRVFERKSGGDWREIK